MKRKLTIVCADDWQALYDKNGVLITQGHEVSLFEFAEAAGVELNEIAAYDFLDAYERDVFPIHLAEIKPD